MLMINAIFINGIFWVVRKGMDEWMDNKEMMKSIFCMGII